MPRVASLAAAVYLRNDLCILVAPNPVYRLPRRFGRSPRRPGVACTSVRRSQFSDRAESAVHCFAKVVLCEKLSYQTGLATVRQFTRGRNPSGTGSLCPTCLPQLIFKVKRGVGGLTRAWISHAKTRVSLSLPLAAFDLSLTCNHE